MMFSMCYAKIVLSLTINGDRKPSGIDMAVSDANQAQSNSKTPPLQNLSKELGGTERYDRRRRAVNTVTSTVTTVITVK